MKKFKLLLLLLLLMTGATNAQQICPGSIFSDDYSDPTLWQDLGTNWLPTGCTPTIPATPVGNLIVSTNQRVEWHNFQSRQDYRLVRNIGTTLNQTFRVEFEFEIQNSTDIGFELFALTSNTDHPRCVAMNNAQPSNNNSIEVIVRTDLYQMAPAIHVTSKWGSTPGAESIPIDLDPQLNPVTYYVTLERLNLSLLILNVYTDALRTTHAVGSPQCVQMSSSISNLQFAQHAGLSGTTGCSRRVDAWLDNLCIYENTNADPCLDCSNPLVGLVNTVYNCSTATVTVNPTGGFGTYIFNWSNGSSSQSAVVSAPGAYSVTVTDVITGCTMVVNGSVGSFGFTPKTINPCDGTCSGTIKATNVQNGTPPYQYSIGSGWSSSNTFTGLCAGPYTVTVMDANGCTATEPVTLVNGENWPKHPVTPGSSEAWGWDQTVDDNGYYLTGQFSNSILFQHDYDPLQDVQLNTAGTSDESGFLAKFGQCGVEWAFDIGAANQVDQLGSAVKTVTDPSGNFVIFGGTITGSLPGGFQGATGSAIINPSNINSGTLNLSTDLIAGTKKGYVACVNESDGSPEWIYLVGDSPSETSEVTDIAIDDGGNVYVLANFQGNITMDNSYTGIGDWDVVVFELDLSNGALIPTSVNLFGTNGRDRGEALDVTDESATAAQNLVATGSVTEGAVTMMNSLNNVPPGSGTGNDIFVGVFEPQNVNGMVDISMGVFRSQGDDSGMDIVVSPDVTNDEYFLTGYFQDNLLLPGASAAGVGPTNFDAFISKHELSTHSNFWLDLVQNDGVEIGGSLVQANGSIYACGIFSGQISTFNSILNAQSSSINDLDLYIVELAPFSGSPGVIQTQQGNGNIDFVTSISAHLNTLYTTGTMGNPGPLEFPGQNSLTPASSTQDVYFARLDLGLNFYKTGDASEEESASNDALEMDKILIYPNPSPGQFYIEVESLSDITVMDLSGRVVYSDRILGGKSAINLQKQPSGIYLVEIANIEGVFRQKIVKN